MWAGTIQARMRQYLAVWGLLLAVVLALLAGMVTLGPGELWRQLAATRITMPAWLLGSVMLVALLAILYRAGRNRPVTPRQPELPAERTEFIDRRIRDTEIVLDGKAFQRCEFNNADIVMRGTERFTLSDCQIVQCRIIYDQPAAGVLDMFGALYQDPSFRPIVDDTFNQVRAGQTFG